MTREQVGRTLHLMDGLREQAMEARTFAGWRDKAAEYSQLLDVIMPYITGREPYSPSPLPAIAERAP
jgi:hypothetical protein